MTISLRFTQPYDNKWLVGLYPPLASIETKQPIQITRLDVPEKFDASGPQAADHLLWLNSARMMECLTEEANLLCSVIGAHRAGVYLKTKLQKRTNSM